MLGGIKACAPVAGVHAIFMSGAPMPTKPAGARLGSMRIDEVSGVNAPAHLRDGWAVMKSATTLRELLERAETTAEEAEVTVPNTDDGASAPVDPRDALIAELELKLAAATETPAAEPVDDVAKALESLPDDIQKAVSAQMEGFRKATETAQADAAAAQGVAVRERDLREERESIAKARDEMPFVPVPASVGSSRDDMGRFLHRVQKAQSELGESFAKSADGAVSSLYDQIVDVLKAANGVLETAQVFTELGTIHAAPSEGSAEGKLDSIAKAAAEAEGITFEEAYAKALVANPDLYRSTFKEA
jgi:hypothetical protein